MFPLILGIQKYFTVGLVVTCLLLGSLAWGYRSSARMEAAQRATIEIALRETTTAYAELQQTHAKQLEALFRADAAITLLRDQHRSARESILNAPQDQDAPVSPILRCTITGVC